MVDVNYIAIIIAAVLNMVIGYIWYSPAVFGKTWMKMANISEASMKKGMGKAIGMGIVASLITAYVLAQLIDLTGAVGVAGAVTLAFWVWLGFTATAMYSAVIYENRNIKLWAINTGYYLVSYIVMAAVIVLWV